MAPRSRWLVLQRTLVTVFAIGVVMIPVEVRAVADGPIAMSAMSSCTIGSFIIGSTTCTYKITNGAASPVTFEVVRLDWPSGQDVVSHFGGDPSLSGAQPVAPGNSVILSQLYSYGLTLSTHTANIGWIVYATDSTTRAQVSGLFFFKLRHDAGCSLGCSGG